MRPKLLILSGLYPNPDNPERGTFVKLQAEELAWEYDVRVIAWDFPGPARSWRWREGEIEVDYLRFKTMKSFFPSSIPAFRYNVLPHVKRICSRWKPDLIQVHDFAHLPGPWVLKSWLDRSTIPKFLTLHNLKSLPGLMNHPATNFIYATTLGKALGGWNCIFTVNQALATQATKYGSKVLCIGNGVKEADRMDNPVLREIREWLGIGATKILSVGNLIKSKGFDLLIRSVRDLRDKGLKARVLIVGRGPEQQFLEDLVRELGLEGQVRLYGPLPHGEVRSLYYDFDLFALPSHNETFGMVYLEAAWAGIPSIGVRGQGIWGLFDQGSEALFMEPGDQASLTDLMRQLMIDPELRKRLGRNAKTKCEREFRLERVLVKMKAEYRRSMP